MKLHGQKWIFQDGNHEIIVENAAAWTMFSQERIRVNGETVFSRAGYFWFAVDWTSAHTEPWMTQLGDETLHVEYKSGVGSISVRVKIGDRELEPADYFEGNWNTKSKNGDWPD